MRAKGEQQSTMPPLQRTAIDAAAPGHLDQLIQTRRSIRRYSSEAIPREVVREILHAAMRAPSPHNRQPWRFAVLRTNCAKARLALAMGKRLRADRTRDGDDAETIEADISRSRMRIESAPVVILVALTMRDMDAYADQHRANAEHTMAVQSVASAIQNVLLLAHARGLGSCWMCAPLFCPDIVRTSLDLPEEWEPQALITLGLPAAPGRDRTQMSADDMIVWIDDSPH